MDLIINKKPPFVEGLVEWGKRRQHGGAMLPPPVAELPHAKLTILVSRPFTELYVPYQVIGAPL